MKHLDIAAALILAAGLVLCSEFLAAGGKSASLLLSLTIWVSVAQGAVALVAACELTNAKWIEHFRQRLLALIPLLPLGGLLFLFLGFQTEIYPWHEAPTWWLNPSFFIVRNVLLLLLCWVLSLLLKQALENKSKKAGQLCVLYLFVFVLAQSFVAFDWLMTLDYPWRSTLFGLYFAVEALLAALAIASFCTDHRPHTTAKGEKDKILPDAAVRDLATLVFGFCVLWAGLFFAQFLVIWYGNLPEERGYLYVRGWESPYQNVSVLFLLGIFFLPFTLFLSRRAKQIPALVSTGGALVLAAFALERWLFIAPNASVALPATLLQTIILGALVIFLVTRKPRPASVS